MKTIERRKKESSPVLQVPPQVVKLADRIRRRDEKLQTLQQKQDADKSDFAAMVAVDFYKKASHRPTLTTAKVMADTGNVLFIQPHRTTGDIDRVQVQELIGEAKFKKWFERQRTISIDLNMLPHAETASFVLALHKLVHSLDSDRAMTLIAEWKAKPKFYTERHKLPLYQNIQLDEVVRPVRTVKPERRAK